MAISPTQRTLRALEQRGCLCGIVERFNPYAGPHGIRQDLFGIIDVIALYPNQVAGIQCCGQAFADHDKKILASEISIEWIRSGGALELWGWRKIVKKRGSKQKIWSPRVKIYTLDDFTA